MKDIYSDAGSDYMQLTKSWHVEDSPWKASNIWEILKKNNISPKSVVEVGCGLGEILYSLNDYMKDDSIRFDGYDIATDAIEIASKKQRDNVKFYCEDFTAVETQPHDVLLMIDVFEHVPDYIGFIEKCNDRATYKIFHIPLELHMLGLLRNQLVEARKGIGHLHYFSKETALATLEDTGLEIIDYTYTHNPKKNKRTRRKIADVPRRMMFPVIPNLTVKLLGGYSLMVLAK